MWKTEETLETYISPSTVWVPEVILGSSGLATAAFTHRAISPAQLFFMLIVSNLFLCLGFWCHGKIPLSNQMIQICRYVLFKELSLALVCLYLWFILS